VAADRLGHAERHYVACLIRPSGTAALHCAEWEPILRAIGSTEADPVPKIHQYRDTFRCRAPPRSADQEGLLHIVDPLPRPGRQ
jgi:hypothetical protein